MRRNCPQPEVAFLPMYWQLRNSFSSHKQSLNQVRDMCYFGNPAIVTGVETPSGSFSFFCPRETPLMRVTQNVLAMMLTKLLATYINAVINSVFFLMVEDKGLYSPQRFAVSWRIYALIHGEGHCAVQRECCHVLGIDCCIKTAHKARNWSFPQIHLLLKNVLQFCFSLSLTNLPTEVLMIIVYSPILFQRNFSSLTLAGTIHTFILNFFNIQLLFLISFSHLGDLPVHLYFTKNFSTIFISTVFIIFLQL